MKGSGMEHSTDEMKERKRRRERALRLLVSRELSGEDLRGRLGKWGASAEEAEALVASARESGLINEERLAEAWVAGRQGQRGKRQLRQELRRRGVGEETADAAVSVVDVEVEVRAARNLTRLHLRRLQGLPAVVAQRRLAGLLGRRGFGGAALREGLSLLGREGEDLPVSDETEGP